MDLVELGPLSAAQVSELEGDEIDPYGSVGSDLVWGSKDHHVALQDEQGRLLAAGGWLIVEIEVGSQPVEVVAIGDVIVAAEHRGKGLGRRVIGEVIDRAGRAGPELAMLFCQLDKVDLYRRRGFTLSDQPVEVGQPAGPVKMPLEMMWRPLRGGAVLPDGPVRVPGLPF